MCMCVYIYIYMYIYIYTHATYMESLLKQTASSMLFWFGSKFATVLGQMMGEDLYDLSPEVLLTGGCRDLSTVCLWLEARIPT